MIFFFLLTFNLVIKCPGEFHKPHFSSSGALRQFFFNSVSDLNFISHVRFAPFDSLPLISSEPSALIRIISYTIIAFTSILVEFIFKYIIFNYLNVHLFLFNKKYIHTLTGHFTLFILIFIPFAFRKCLRRFHPQNLNSSFFSLSVSNHSL